MLLMGFALVDFNNVASICVAETREHYLQCINAATIGVFDQDALKDQKTWMQLLLKKPADLLTGDYMDRVVNLNNNLPHFHQQEEEEIL